MPQVQQQSVEYNYTKKQITMGVVAMFAVYGTMAYFVQSLTIARPRMAADLNGMSLYAWAVSIPSLFSAFVTLVFGKFSDMYGRRIMLMISLSLSLIGTIMSALSPTFEFLIVASVLGMGGAGAMMPLVFSVVGDLFPPHKRSKWIGLLNIPTGIFSLFGPMLGGWFVDNRSWRELYWISLPLLVVCLITVPIGVPSIRSTVKGKIDVLGCILVGIASSATIIGLSFAGDKYPWGSVQIVGLLLIALIFWVLFFTVETKVGEPILDPLVFLNRSFLTVAVAGFLSFFGQMGMMMYFPIFLQGVQGVSAFRNSFAIIPLNVLMSFVGVPVGFILARSKHFKWMYILGYGILTVVMFGIIFFTENTSFLLSVITSMLIGLGLGAIPTVNTMVVQNAVPKRLLGVAMGAMSFCIMMGVAISPAVLGAANNAAYSSALKASLSEELKQTMDKETAASIGNSRVLLSQPALAELEGKFKEIGGEGNTLFKQAVQAIRTSTLAGFKSVFWISAVAMLLAFLLICTIPENSLDIDNEDGKSRESLAPPQSAG
jgi:MFS family permease